MRVASSVLFIPLAIYYNLGLTMASESAGIVVWITDLHRSRNAVCVGTAKDMHVADFITRVMFSRVVVDENRWSCEHHSDATLLLEDGKTPVDTRLLLSCYLNALSGNVKFILEPPRSPICPADAAGMPSAAGSKDCTYALYR
jgi:hypothetical protein